MTVPSEPPAASPSTPPALPFTEPATVVVRRRRGTMPSTPRSILDALRRAQEDRDK